MMSFSSSICCSVIVQANVMSVNIHNVPRNPQRTLLLLVIDGSSSALSTCTTVTHPYSSFQLVEPLRAAE